MPITLARQLAYNQSYTELESWIARFLDASEDMVTRLIAKHSWAIPTEERQWIAEILKHPQQANAETRDTIGDLSQTETNGRMVPTTQRDTGREVDASETPVDSQVRSTRGVLDTGNNPEMRGRRTGIKGNRDTGTNSGTNSQAKAPQTGRGTRSRRVSYVEPQSKDDSSSDTDSLQQRKEVEQAAIDAVLAYEKSQGRDPIVMEEGHEGYDIESYEVSKILQNRIDSNIANSNVARYIEVKGIRNQWDSWGVSVHAPQYEAARRHGDKFYLYVVDNALNPREQQLYIFRNPANKIDEYQFDYKWTEIADETVLPN